MKHTHHFKVAGGNNEVVDDVVDLGDQRQDGGLHREREVWIRTNTRTGLG